MIPITVNTANAMLTKLHTPPIIRETVSLTAPTALTIILLTNVHANWGYREDKSLIRVEARISRFPCGKERNKHEYSQISEYRHNLIRLNVVLVELGRCVGRVIELIDFCSEILLFLFPRLCLRRSGHNRVRRSLGRSAPRHLSLSRSWCKMPFLCILPDFLKYSNYTNIPQSLQAQTAIALKALSVHRRADSSLPCAKDRRACRYIPLSTACICRYSGQ